MRTALDAALTIQLEREIAQERDRADQLRRTTGAEYHRGYVDALRWVLQTAAPRPPARGRR
jgi:hypothetical protein